MQTTFIIFDDRKEEIDFYYSKIIEFESDGESKTTHNNKLVKIMKSNLLLMLYNLIEACVVSGMVEIYDSLKNDKCPYISVISEIKTMWAKNKINEIYGPTTERVAYERRVQLIIDNIVSNQPIILNRAMLGIKGNLNAKKIVELCDHHGIRYHLQTRGDNLNRIRLGRNNLAHGDVSFTDCARGLPLSELKIIKDEVFLFMEGILNGMKNYYDGKLYRKI